MLILPQRNFSQEISANLHLEAENQSTNHNKNSNTISTYELMVEKGRGFFLESERDSAIQYFSMAIKLKPNRVEAYYSLGYVYSINCCKGDTTGCSLAIYFFTESIRKDPHYRNQHYNLAVCKFSIGHYLEGLQEIELAIKNETPDSDYYTLKSSILANLVGTSIPSQKNVGKRVLNSSVLKDRIFRKECTDTE